MIEQSLRARDPFDRGWGRYSSRARRDWVRHKSARAPTRRAHLLTHRRLRRIATRARVSTRLRIATEQPREGSMLKEQSGLRGFAARAAAGCSAAAAAHGRGSPRRVLRRGRAGRGPRQRRLFNETPPPPGQSRKWEDWEAPWYATSRPRSGPSCTSASAPSRRRAAWEAAGAREEVRRTSGVPPRVNNATRSPTNVVRLVMYEWTRPTGASAPATSRWEPPTEGQEILLRVEDVVCPQHHRV